MQTLVAALPTLHVVDELEASHVLGTRTASPQSGHVIVLVGSYSRVGARNTQGSGDQVSPSPILGKISSGCDITPLFLGATASRES
jgi:hypothetical protein